MLFSSSLSARTPPHARRGGAPVRPSAIRGNRRKHRPSRGARACAPSPNTPPNWPAPAAQQKSISRWPFPKRAPELMPPRRPLQMAAILHFRFIPEDELCLSLQRRQLLGESQCDDIDKCVPNRAGPPLESVLSDQDTLGFSTRCHHHLRAVSRTLRVTYPTAARFSSMVRNAALSSRARPAGGRQ